MKRWVVFVELTDDLPANHCLQLNEERIRAKFEEFSKELPPSITLKIRGLTGPFTEYGKAAGAR